MTDRLRNDLTEAAALLARAAGLLARAALRCCAADEPCCGDDLPGCNHAGQGVIARQRAAAGFSGGDLGAASQHRGPAVADPCCCRAAARAPVRVRYAGGLEVDGVICDNCGRFSPGSSPAGDRAAYRVAPQPVADADDEG